MIIKMRCEGEVNIFANVDGLGEVYSIDSSLFREALTDERISERHGDILFHLASQVSEEDSVVEVELEQLKKGGWKMLSKVVTPIEYS